ncbi:DNA-directed RNA polymerase II subunit [Lithohypha guttulata]|uniref:DNA-directed RNA polymerase subunit n=1 Tax=Lithohypha guttulata TaxID=1690604 RepID=A0AAN7Y7Y4_9EURO|nr:DNA-directed RNA polymerase II subunit [Lithohypha guttulata]KAK5088513.1 DNA-directed RNA polymerase II subunit [Lithohypha guttulata]KAK5106957.1 DNA-directed RNA polymerase II subunit [Lithohypha guttulata]
MFFLKYLEREISLHPSFLGNNIAEFLTDKLYDDMEGSCNGEYYIICIMDIYNISAGKVRPGTGIAEFTILYRAILWKPFKGEAHLPAGFKYNPDATPVQYVGTDGAIIEKGSAVRVQLMGLRTDVNQLFGIGKMSAGWFGPI